MKADMSTTLRRREHTAAIHRDVASLPARADSSHQTFFSAFLALCSLCLCGWFRSQAQQVRDQVILLLAAEVQLQDKVEELDRVMQRRAAAIMQVRGCVLDAAQREGLDRPLRAADVEALYLQIVHVVVH